MKQINIWDLWEKEWNNASKFFNCKGNVKTKSRLKDKWHKEFVDSLKIIEKTTRENLLTQAKS